MIRIDALRLAAEPIDMRAGVERLLARVVQVDRAPRPYRWKWVRLGHGATLRRTERTS